MSEQSWLIRPLLATLLFHYHRSSNHSIIMTKTQRPGLNRLRDANFGSRRQAIIAKYDTNGNGVFQGAEIDNILDDYMTTIQNNDTLLNVHSNQKRLLSIASIIIVLLAISNLGTALLAANMSKETVVIDGRFVANDGSAEAISTRNSVETINRQATVKFCGCRNLVENVDAYDADDEDLTFACFTAGEVDAIFESVINGSGTNIVIQSEEDDASISRTVVPIHGTGHAGSEGLSFPDASFVHDEQDLCAEESRRRMAEQDRRGLAFTDEKMMILLHKN